MMSGTGRILVTGASGFIGTHLTKLLVSQGYDVTGLVRTYPVLPVPGVEYKVGDLLDLENLDLDLQAFESVVHAAGRAHGKGGSSADSDDTLDAVNVAPAVQLAEKAKQNRVGRFVFLSSIGVNGDETFDRPITEVGPERPHGSYARSKLRAEKALFASLSGSSTSLTIIRPPLVYGIDAPGNFGKLLRLCGTGIPLPFRGTDNRRSLISIGSLSDLILLCLQKPEAENQTFVAADPDPISTEAIVGCLQSGMYGKERLFPVPRKLMSGACSLIGKESMFTQLFGNLEVNAEKAVTCLGWEREGNGERALRAIGQAYKAMG